MTGLTRRQILQAAPALALALAGVPAQATGGWIEVTGTAPLQGGGDLSIIRRRAIADALLEAALAGGADVRGHSVVSQTRLTSDLLFVRPTGQVLEHRLLREGQDGALYRVHLRARVAPPAARACTGNRRLHLTVYPPRVQIGTPAPAWVEALTQELVRHMVEDSRRHPAVDSVALVDRLPHPNAAKDKTSYRAILSGAGRPSAAGHGLQTEMRAYLQDSSLYLDLWLRLQGPEGETAERRLTSRVPMPGVSLNDRAAPPSLHGRYGLAAALGAEVRPALNAVLTETGCQPVRLKLALQDNRLTVPAGRIHGITPTSLAVTLSGAPVPDMLEITRLSDARAELRPLDPTRRAASLAGQVVRFIETNDPLP